MTFVEIGLAVFFFFRIVKRTLKQGSEEADPNAMTFPQALGTDWPHSPPVGDPVASPAPRGKASPAASAMPLLHLAAALGPAPGPKAEPVLGRTTQGPGRPVLRRWAGLGTAGPGSSEARKPGAQRAAPS